MSVKLIPTLKNLPISGPGPKFTVLVLALYADADGRNAFPAVGTLAEDLSVDERTVKRYLRQLEQTGWIRRGDQTVAQHLKHRAPVVWDIALTDEQAAEWSLAAVADPQREERRKAGRRGGHAGSASRWGMRLGSDEGGDTGGDKRGYQDATQISNNQLLTRDNRGLRPPPRLRGGVQTEFDFEWFVGDEMPAPGFEEKPSGAVPRQRRSEPDDGPSGGLGLLETQDEIKSPQKPRGSRGARLSDEFRLRLQGVDLHRQHDGSRFAPALAKRMRDQGVDEDTVRAMIDLYFADRGNLARLDRKRYAYAHFLQLWADLLHRVRATQPVEYTVTAGKAARDRELLDL